MRVLLCTLVVSAFLAISLAGLSAPGNVGAGGEDKNPAKKVSAAEIENLVKQLGSENSREAASKALLKIGDDALPALKAAAKSDDADLRRAAEPIYTKIHAARIRAKAERAANYGIDVVVERMVKKGKNLSDEDWQVLCRILDDARTEAEARGVKGIHPYPPAEILALPLLVEPVEKEFGGKKWNDCFRSRLLAESIKVRFDALGSIVICGGKIDTEPSGSCILANGDIRASPGVTGSILICDGDVWMNTVGQCIVLASGRIKIRSPAGAKDFVIREKYTAGFSKIRFFSVSDLGVQIAGEPIAGEEPVGAYPISVEADSLLGKHGLKPGQQFWSINGARPKGADEARIMLRSGIAEGRLVIEVLGRKAPIKIDFPW